MPDIDEKAILRWLEIEQGTNLAVPLGEGEYLDKYGIIQNIYSLDWQAKYPDKKLTDLGYDIKLFSDDGYYFCNIYENCEDGMSDPVGASIVGTESQAAAKLWAYTAFIENKGIKPPLSAGSNGAD